MKAKAVITLQTVRRGLNHLISSVAGHLPKTITWHQRSYTRFNFPAKRFLWNIFQNVRRVYIKKRGDQLNYFVGVQWRKTDYTRFIVLAEMRTGSTMLERLLRSHPNIKMRNELLNPKRPSQKNQQWINATREDPGKALTKFLDENIYKAYDQTIKAAGYKYMYGHRFIENWDVIWRYLQRTHVHVIHLKRRNLLDRYLSNMLAMRSAQWIAKNLEANRHYNDPIEIDPAKCIDNIMHTLDEQNLYNYLLRDNPKIELVYEDLVENYEQEIRRILDFLNVEYHPLTTQTIKQRRKPRSEVIANYDELKAAFQAAAKANFIPSDWLTYFDDE